MGRRPGGRDPGGLGSRRQPSSSRVATETLRADWLLAGRWHLVTQCAVMVSWPGVTGRGVEGGRQREKGPLGRCCYPRLPTLDVGRLSTGWWWGRKRPVRREGARSKMKGFGGWGERLAWNIEVREDGEKQGW